MSIIDRFRLTGKKAIVTGAAQGIGHHVAIALAEAGADVALFDLNKATETQEKIRAQVCGRVAIDPARVVGGEDEKRLLRPLPQRAGRAGEDGVFERRPERHFTGHSISMATG